ncbi:MAG: GDSL-type esterase/lipase family protein [Acidobacteriaceae bacterium]|nr:GDSL-type esterase/lipase family protein [Acidobacteriaceae bacterium]
MKLKFVFAMLALGGALCLAQEQSKPNEIAKVDDTAKIADTIRIVLAGDSTVSHSSGWGSGFCDDLAGQIECFNMSKSGRSTKSYRNEGWWQRALDLKPTYILISFGGNDVPGKGPERETDPKTTYPELLKKDIAEAQAAGAHPILVTDMQTRKYKDGKLLHPWAAYIEAMLKVGAETNTPVIDLNARTTACLDTMTQAQADTYNKYYPDPKLVDRAHINAKGSQMIGTMVAEDFAKIVPKLAKYIQMQNPPVDNEACR